MSLELARNERGSVTTEYVVLLVLVTIFCSLALVLTGVPLVRMFTVRQAWLLLPFP